MWFASHFEHGRARVQAIEAQVQENLMSAGKILDENEAREYVAKMSVRCTSTVLVVPFGDAVPSASSSCMRYRASVLGR